MVNFVLPKDHITLISSSFWWVSVLCKIGNRSWKFTFLTHLFSSQRNWINDQPTQIGSVLQVMFVRSDRCSSITYLYLPSEIEKIDIFNWGKSSEGKNFHLTFLSFKCKLQQHKFGLHDFVAHQILSPISIKMFRSPISAHGMLSQ